MINKLGDGRVKGGLNLSRAFGDHIYKDNSQIPLKDQMITALPGITWQVLSIKLRRFVSLET